MIEWKEDNKKYYTGYRGMVGKISFFNLYWDASTSNGDNKKWKLACKLPGIKDTLGHFEKKEDGFEMANNALAFFLLKTGLKK